MRTFETGATRDSDDNKLDYEGFLSPVVLKRFAEYMHRHRTQADGQLRDSDNWQKGIPRDAYMKSLFRHFMDVWSCHRGIGSDEQLEEALCAMLFNVQGYLHEYLTLAPGECPFPLSDNRAVRDLQLQMFSRGALPELIQAIGRVTQDQDGPREAIAYLSGPMRGIADYNFPAFDEARNWALSSTGYVVISPADVDRAMGGQTDLLPVEYAIRDTTLLTSMIPDRDIVFLLPGWRQSVGARAEEAVARWVGLRVREVFIGGLQDVPSPT